MVTGISKKSIFICVLFHAVYNASSSIGLSCPSNGQYIVAIIWVIYGGVLLLYDYLNDRKKVKIEVG